MDNQQREKVLDIIRNSYLLEYKKEELRLAFIELICELDRYRKADKKSGGYRVEEHTTDEDRKKGIQQLQIVPAYAEDKVKIIWKDEVEKMQRLREEAIRTGMPIIAATQGGIGMYDITYTVRTMQDELTCDYCRQYHGYTVVGTKALEILMRDMKKRCGSELGCRCACKNEDKNIPLAGVIPDGPITMILCRDFDINESVLVGDKRYIITAKEGNKFTMRPQTVREQQIGGAYQGG